MRITLVNILHDELWDHSCASTITKFALMETKMRTPRRRVNVILGFSFGAIIVTLSLWFFTNRKELNETSSKSSSPWGGSPSRAGSASSSDHLETSIGKSPLELSISNRLQARTAARDQSRDQWRTPIEFYGKVLDHKDQPVEGATVMFSCNDLSVEGLSKYSRQTDSEGLFSLTGIEGKVLVVDVSKNGYRSASTEPNAFFYAGIRNVFTPDISNPVLFRLRKETKAEPLIILEHPGIAKIAKLKPDATPTTINLLGEKREPSQGQLTLVFTRGDTPKKGKFDYALELSIPGGGLIENDDGFLLDPPDSGYQPTLQLFVPKEKEDWGLSLRRKFYIKLPGEIFGRLDVSLYAHNGVFTIQSAVNPNGSRNLDGVPRPTELGTQ